MMVLSLRHLLTTLNLLNKWSTNIKQNTSFLLIIFWTIKIPGWFAIDLSNDSRTSKLVSSLDRAESWGIGDKKRTTTYKKYIYINLWYHLLVCNKFFSTQTNASYLKIYEWKTCFSRSTKKLFWRPQFEIPVNRNRNDSSFSLLLQVKWSFFESKQLTSFWASAYIPANKRQKQRQRQKNKKKLRIYFEGQ